MNKRTNFSDFISLGLIRELECLAADYNCVLWINNKEFNQLFYVSNTYHSLWERDCLSLYRDMRSWRDTLDMPNSEIFSKELIEKRNIINPHYTAIYCIKLANKQQRWFQDRSFQLVVTAKQKNIIIAGCALPVSNKLDLKVDQENISDKLDLIIAKFYQILSFSFSNLKEKSKDEQLLNKLSKQQKETLKLILQGKTAAQIADMMDLSPRTVEGYLVNLKNKLFCDSKSELLMKAIENQWLLINI